MQDVIRLLPESLANQIAAGEVVQRPASVVKELLENSIDAGATQISLIIRDAGKSLIQVIDNGKGMSPTDARMSFERHATSKLFTTEDLFNIRTYGFRGEALASIAAVAQVELKTKRPADEVGTRILIEDSKVIVQENTATPNGTNITVRNLFFNVPARRNFLKSNAAEWRHILEEFQRVALAYPQVGMTLEHNGEEIHNLQPSNLARRIIALLGKSYQTQLVPVEQATPLLAVRGYIGKPESAKKTRGEQFLFVNQRFVKHSYLNHAIFSAYEGILPRDSFPFYHLNISIEPIHVDINVHPTKTEVKFDDENSVYNFLKTSVKMALATLGVAPAIDFDFDINLKTVFESPATKERSHLSVSPRYWERLFPRIADSELAGAHDFAESSQQMTFQGLNTTASQPQVWQCLNLKNNYLATPLRSGLALIYLPAALQRIEYERAMARFGDSAACQVVAFPTRIELDPADSALLMDSLQDFSTLGFDIQPLGQGSFAVTGIPADLGDIAEKGLVEQIIEQIKTSTDRSLPSRERIVRSYARRVAGMRLKNFRTEQAGQIVEALLACQTPNYSPDGGKALVILDYGEIEQMFR